MKSFTLSPWFLQHGFFIRRLAVSFSSVSTQFPAAVAILAPKLILWPVPARSGCFWLSISPLSRRIRAFPRVPSCQHPPPPLPSTTKFTQPPAASAMLVIRNSFLTSKPNPAGWEPLAETETNPPLPFWASGTPSGQLRGSGRDLRQQRHKWGFLHSPHRALRRLTWFWLNFPRWQQEISLGEPQSMENSSSVGSLIQVQAVWEHRILFALKILQFRLQQPLPGNRHKWEQLEPMK